MPAVNVLRMHSAATSLLKCWTKVALELSSYTSLLLSFLYVVKSIKTSQAANQLSLMLKFIWAALVPLVTSYFPVTSQYIFLLSAFLCICVGSIGSSPFLLLNAYLKNNCCGHGCNSGGGGIWANAVLVLWNQKQSSADNEPLKCYGAVLESPLIISFRNKWTRSEK